MISSKWGKLLLAVAAASCACGCALITRGPAASPAGAADAAEAGKINHIIVMVQENRSFDSYFAKLNDYRVANGWGRSNDVDVESDTASNPADDGNLIHAFHLKTGCIDNVSPDWLESHADVNRWNPATSTELKMDGFVHTAAGLAQFNGDYDTRGARAMGYYDENDLPVYYFLAGQFATSDRWFAPVPANSEVNRIYLHAATSEGHAHKPSDTFGCCTSKTIFHLLDAAGISWKIYYSD